MTPLTGKAAATFANNWLPGYRLDIDASNEKAADHPLKTSGVYELSSHRTRSRETGTRNHDCRNEAECDHHLKAYEQACHNGRNPELIAKAVGLIKQDPVASFSLRRDLEKRTHSYIEICSNCSGQGCVRCHNCSGSGQVTCWSCSGGRVSCGSCSGGYIHGSNGSRQRCYSCSGSGYRDCSACYGNGKRTCGTCNGTRTLSCSPCAGTGRFTVSLSAIMSVQAHQKCRWASSADFPWLDHYVTTALNGRVPQAPLNRVASWQLDSFRFEEITGFPLISHMEGSLHTASSDIKVDGQLTQGCHFVGGALVPYDLKGCFDQAVVKETERLAKRFDDEACKRLFATPIASSTFELVASDKLPGHNGYYSRGFTGRGAKALKDSLLGTAKHLDQARQSLSLKRFGLSFGILFTVLVLLLALLDSLAGGQIQWHLYASVQVLGSALVSLKLGLMQLLNGQPYLLIKVLLLSFLPAMAMRQWLGSDQIWRPWRLFGWYMGTTLLMSAILVQSHLHPGLSGGFSLGYLSLSNLLGGVGHVAAIGLDLVMLCGLLAIFRARRAAFSANRRQVRAIGSSALNRLMNYE
ncbi:hypothetical protein [Gallaecimonas xiamenensis]|uniref:CR-type domain-containing protein n=1 Tax=Gallaecimonas xiamenensis 3-C-1 TaxID=745411 RepID=K2IWW4_9GAMM|nr:hypothetical protein [Gallaecimonas xiamenensis]EKE74981.1 hypothetical protein B3C1_08836 [Gallaecimonas xiamenensis 3-C-1]